MSTTAASLPGPNSPVPPLIAASPRGQLDFPSWVPAMLVKELRQGLRARGFVGALVLAQLIMAIMTVAAVTAGSGSDAHQILQATFWTIVGVQLLLITPVRALSGLQAELENRAIDLLVLTRLTAWRIVLGKWISLNVQGLLVVITMLPYGVARYFFGSVNLAQDFGSLGMMVAGSALASAVALWASGMPKFARIGLIVLAVMGFQIIPAIIAFSSAMTGSRAGAPFSGPSGIGTVLWNGALVTLLALLSAVRRIAPPAENHAQWIRLIPLMVLAPFLFLSGREVLGQAFVAGALALFVGSLELSRPDEPMAAHWRAWRRKGFGLSALARYFQPGIASGLEWLILTGGIMVAMAIVIGGMDGGTSMADVFTIIRAILLGITALATPAVLLTYLRGRHQRIGLYYLILLAGSLIAALLIGLNSIGELKPFDQLLHILPISSFWMSLNRSAVPEMYAFVGQILVTVGILGWLSWRLRGYREERQEFERAARA